MNIYIQLHTPHKSPLAMQKCFLVKIIFSLFLLLLNFQLSTFTFAQSAPFPTDHLQLWLRADSVELTNGKVSRWYDLSHNNYIIQQTSTTSRPTIKESAINGNPALQFNGTSTYLTGGDILDLGSDSWTWIIIGKSNLNTWNRPFIAKSLYGSEPARYSLSTNRLVYYANNVEYSVATSPVPQTSQWYMLTWENNRTTLKNNIYVNGTLHGSASFPSYNMQNSRSFLVGAYNGSNGTTPGNNYYLNGEIAEIIVFNNIDITTNKYVYTYLAEKYFPEFLEPSVSLGDDIHIPYGFCDTTITTAYNPDFRDYIWNTGETDSVIYATQGRYTVTVTNRFGVTSTDEINIYFPEVNPIQYPTICPNGTTYWNTGLPSEYYNFQWFKDDIQTSNLPILPINSIGAYTGIITDTLGCSLQTDTIHITIDNYYISTSFGNGDVLPTDTSMCSGNTLGLGTNVEETTSYIWSTDAISPRITITEPGNYTLTSTNNRGCIAVNTINVNILGEAPELEYSIENLCFGDSTSIISTAYSEQGIESYLWIIDETDSIDTQNFNYRFATTGNHDIRTIVTSNNTCITDSSFNIPIKELPIPSFTYTPVCPGVPMNFVDSSIIPEGTTAESYSWMIGDSVIGNGENLTYTFREAPTPFSEQLVHTVTLSNGCSADTTINITIRADYDEPRYVAPSYPINGMYVNTDSITFEWSYDYDVLYYSLIISAYADFTYADTIICTATSIRISTEGFADTSYWKVAAYNHCLISHESEPYSFKRIADANLAISSNNPDLQLWLRADSVELSGGKVSQWYDLSQNNYVIQQNAANARPIVNDTAINNHPALQFNGTSSYLTGGDILDLDLDSWTWFIVGKSNINAWNRPYITKSLYGSEVGRYSLSSRRLMYITTNNVEYNVNIPADAIQESQWHLIEWENDRTTLKNKIYVNGTMQGSTSFPSYNMQNSRSFLVGAYNSTNGTTPQTDYYLNGEIAEVIALNNTNEIVANNINNYLIEKYFPEYADSLTDYDFGNLVYLGLDLHIPYGFCDTAITTAYNPDFKSYQWSTGETDSVIHVNRSGRYTVTVTNSFGVTSTDDINVYFPKHFQLQDTTICSGDTIYWNLKMHQDDYSFMWYRDGEQIANASNQIEISEAGVYTCIITDSIGCRFETDTLNFAIDDYPISTSFSTTNADTSMCLGNTLGLGTNIEETTSYIWNTGSTSLNIAPAESGSYTLTSTNYRGCIAVNTINVNILGEAPELEYSIGNLCLGDSTSIISTAYSEQGIESYLWIIDETDSIDTQNFNYRFATTGNHDIRTIVTSNNTCITDSSFNIPIKELPIPSFTYTPVCPGVPMNFVDSSIIPEGTTAESYSWMIGDSVIGNGENLTYTFREAPTPFSEQLVHTVTLSNGCSADTTINITIRADYDEPRYVAPSYPINGMYVNTDSITFEWSYDYDVLYYSLIISAYADFTYADTIICTATSIRISTEGFADTSYWKVAAYNHCLISHESEPYSFKRIADANLAISSNNPDLQLWLRADSVELSGGKVSQWYDLSQNNYVIQQNAANARPIVNDTAINNHPALQFNGTSSYLTGGDILDLDLDSWTWFIVGKSNINAWNRPYITKSLYGSEVGRYSLSSRRLMYITTNNVEYNVNIPADAIQESQWHLIEWENDRTTLKNKIYVNGTMQGSTSFPSYNMQNSRSFLVGAYNSSNGTSPQTDYYLNGEIAEIIALNNTNEIVANNINNYLIEKYFPEYADSLADYDFGNLVYLGLDIHVPYGFCDTAITTAYNPDFISYQWNTGETDSVIHVSQPGRYTVTVTNSFGVTSTDDINVYFPEHFQMQDTTICAGDTIRWNLKMRQDDYSFMWYRDGEQLANANNQIEISEAGAYTCLITDTLGCSFQIDTLHLTIDNYPISAGFGNSDTTLCYGNRLHITSGYSETASAIWNDGTTDLEHYLTQSGTYTVTTTNARGCTTTNSIDVTIQGQVPTPNFTTEGHCQYAEVTTTNLSTSEVGEMSQYRWFANDSLIGTSENISHSFDEYGTQSLKLYLETSDHCFNDTTIPIYIYPQPKPDFSPKHFCQNASTEISARTTIAEGNIINHLWNLGDDDITGESITNTFESYGIKTITLTAESEQGCIGTKDIEVNVLQAEMPTTEISGICLGYETTFINKTPFNNINPQTAWEWNFGDDTETSSNKNTTHTYDTTGTYNVSLSVSFANHCTTTTGTTITIHELPEATITANDGCIGSETTLDAEIISVDNISAYKWQIDSIFESSERHPTFVSDTTGTFAVTLDVLTEFSCQTQATDSIVIHGKPDVAFTQSRDWGGSPLYVDFENKSESATSYHWDFGNEGESSQANPYFIFTEPGTYEVSLIGTNEFGCSSKYTSSAITVVEPIVDIMLMDLKTNEENGFAKISLIIVNLGTLPVEDLVLELKINNQIYHETIGHIAQGAVVPHTFGTMIPIPNSASIANTICVEALVPDSEGHSETNLANNTLCITDAENLSVGIPYPIPAYEQITCNIYTKIPTDLDISIFSIFGKLVKHETISQHKGYLKYVVNVTDLSGGMYFIRVNSKDENITHKFEIR